jgi:hypothetical protein
MSARSILLNQDDFTIPAVIESGEGQEKLNRLADEIGSASWKDRAALRPRSQYSYDVVET